MQFKILSVAVLALMFLAVEGKADDKPVVPVPGNDVEVKSAPLVTPPPSVEAPKPDPAAEFMRRLSLERSQSFLCGYVDAQRSIAGVLNTAPPAWSAICQSLKDEAVRNMQPAAK